MKLRDFVAECGGVNKFADRLGISPDYVRKLIAGDRRPGRELAKRIEDESGGRLTRMYLVWGDD